MSATGHTRYADWDAAYVLGSLSPADRREFETHLEGCKSCRAAVAELSALPGLLGRLDAARAFAVLDPEDDGRPPADLVERIRARDRARRVRRGLFSAGAVAAAAALATVLTLTVPALFSSTEPPVTQPTPQVTEPPAATVAFVATADDVPVEATAELSRLAWGTSIRMTCTWHPDPVNGPYTPVQYALWVTDADGSESALSTWSSGAGDQVVVTAGTAVALDDIAHLQVRDASGERVLLDAALSS
ncbi:MAG: anti-sigma factor [Microbacteriaceae bacterium]